MHHNIGAFRKMATAMPFIVTQGMHGVSGAQTQLEPVYGYTQQMPATAAGGAKTAGTHPVMDRPMVMIIHSRCLAPVHSPYFGLEV